MMMNSDDGEVAFNRRGACAMHQCQCIKIMEERMVCSGKAKNLSPH
jgi:hypothetical protein